jgi:hypothetical protein
MLVTGLMLIFASFGYRALKNGIVVTTVVLAAQPMSGPLYLTMDRDIPFDGSMRIAPTPLQRAPMS